MTTAKFSEEFARLILRYTDTFLWNNDTSNAIMSLTEEEIVHTIHHVLQIFSITGFENKKNKNLLEIPNSTIAAISETSDVDVKSKPNDEIIHAYRSGQSVYDGDASTSDDCILYTSLKTSKKDQKNSFNTLRNETKFMSRSSPVICINKIIKPNTFREETGQDRKYVFEDFINSEINDLNDCIQVVVDMQKLTMDIMEKLKKDDLRQSIKLLKEEKKTKIMQPTSSKLLVENRNISERRKRTGGIRTNKPVKKCGEFKEIEGFEEVEKCRHTLKRLLPEYISCAFPSNGDKPFAISYNIVRLILSLSHS